MTEAEIDQLAHELIDQLVDELDKVCVDAIKVKAKPWQDGNAPNVDT